MISKSMAYGREPKGQSEKQTPESEKPRTWNFEVSLANES